MIELLQSLGNQQSNAIWDPRRNEEHSIRPKPDTESREKLKYIRAKYVEKAFLPPPQRDITSILFDAIDRDDIPQAAYALAMGADVDSTRPKTDNQPPIAIFGWDLSQRCRSYETLDLPYLDQNGELDENKRVATRVRQRRSSDNLDKYNISYALHFALLHGRSKECAQVFPMAEFLIQNGADPGKIDPVTGHPVAELVGFGELVDDEALTYLNSKNAAKGLPYIFRRKKCPPLKAA